jgi:uncharacterized protein (UPF0333 family)
MKSYKKYISLFLIYLTLISFIFCADEKTENNNNNTQTTEKEKEKEEFTDEEKELLKKTKKNLTSTSKSHV